MLHITLIPALSDNYVPLVRCVETGTTAVIDPATAQDVLNALNGARLDMILNTHHHADHTGGNTALHAQTAAPVWANAADAARIPSVTHTFAVGDVVTIGRVPFTVLGLDGHTMGHVGFYSAEANVLFCGDALFAGGCGRVFEGTYADQFATLQKLAALPPETRIYCGHEYTETNLAFAHQMAPDNAAITARLQAVRALRAKGVPTVPTTLADELATNLFLTAPDVDTFAGLRKARDTF